MNRKHSDLQEDADDAGDADGRKRTACIGAAVDDDAALYLDGRGGFDVMRWSWERSGQEV